MLTFEQEQYLDGTMSKIVLAAIAADAIKQEIAEHMTYEDHLREQTIAAQMIIRRKELYQEIGARL